MFERFSIEAQSTLKRAGLWASADGSRAIDTTHLQRALDGKEPPAGIAVSVWTPAAKQILDRSLRLSVQRHVRTVDVGDLREALDKHSPSGALWSDEISGGGVSRAPKDASHDSPVAHGAETTRSGSPPLSDALRRHASPLGLRAGDITVEGDLHTTPQAAGQPFVVLGDEWAWKAYWLLELELAGTVERVRREGTVALEVDAIDGVIGAASVDEVDGWLVLRMRRMAGTLADHLESRESRAEAPLVAKEYARLIAGVGETLRRLHRRGVVHRDVKPANLLFSPSRDRLYVADFSVVRTRRSDLTRTGATLGTDSYIAPESWRKGESTPASDQYSLGIVARDVFTGRDAPELPGPLAGVLRTATAVDPDDRYPGVDGCRDFGNALVRAVTTESPRTLADRLRDAPPATRFAWAPGVFGVVGYWIKLITDRNPDVILGLETLLLPIAAGFGAYACTRLINLPRGHRTRSGAKILDLWWPPWIIVAGALLLGRGFHGATWFIVIGIPLAFAFVGSYPPRCGYWLPRLIERGSRTWSDYPWLRPLRPVAAQLATVAVILTVAAFIPYWVGRAFPSPYTGPTGLNSGALQAVVAYRAALARGDVNEACSMMDNKVKTSIPCSRWMQLQVLFARESQARAHRRAGHQAIFDQAPLRDIELVRLGTEAAGRTAYLLGYSGSAPSETINTFGTLLIKNTVANVIITEGPAVTPKQMEHQAAWYYELNQEGTFWRMNFTNVCAAGAPTVESVPAGRCVSAMRITPSAITELLAKSHH